MQVCTLSLIKVNLQAQNLLQVRKDDDMDCNNDWFRYMANCFKTAEYCDQSEDPELAETVNDPFVNGVKKNNLVFRAMVLKTLGRVGSVFFKNWTLNYKDPIEK